MNYYIKPVLLVLGILIPGLLKTHAQDEKLKAIFIYNFTRYLDWPEKQGNFVITVLGKSPVIPELTDIASKKQVGTSNIEVKVAGSVQDISESHIVYVSSAKTDLIPAIMPSARNKKFLIISETKGACTMGSGINFINHDGKLSFEISKNNITASGLTVSASLLKLGVAAE